MPKAWSLDTKSLVLLSDFACSSVSQMLIAIVAVVQVGYVVADDPSRFRACVRCELCAGWVPYVVGDLAAVGSGTAARSESGGASVHYGNANSPTIVP
jgi:hypothetical protein